MVANRSPADVDHVTGDVKVCPTLVDLFSGCGGMSLGFKQAGFRLVLAVDISPSANRQYKFNLGLDALQLDLFEASPQQLLEHAKLARGELDVLTACPPCQGFTQLRSRGKSYRTNDLVGRTADIAVEPQSALRRIRERAGSTVWGKGTVQLVLEDSP